MNIFIIIFHLSGQDRELQIVSHIKENRPWARITDNVWCIKEEDNKKTADIRDSLNAKLVIQPSERLMVLNITKSAWASYNLPNEVADWLKE
jgi:hypothetical protein